MSAVQPPVHEHGPVEKTDPPDWDWQAIGATPAFQTLVRRRRRDTAVAVTLSMGSVAGFVALSSFARPLMATTLAGGVSIGVTLAVLELVLLVAAGSAWMHMSVRNLAPLETAAVDAATDLRAAR